MAGSGTTLLAATLMAGIRRAVIKTQNSQTFSLVLRTHLKNCRVTRPTLQSRKCLHAATEVLGKCSFKTLHAAC